ncbi:unnamed protein product [Mycena citricolor]|uniref:BTB domain-containing protein n=2 Tax=Mycena citricolor TaxID=2018698 RepID=A0AAD2HX93_9AGAR|nr:unnamed protein product [Mycena citricolor]
MTPPNTRSNTLSRRSSDSHYSAAKEGSHSGPSSPMSLPASLPSQRGSSMARASWSLHRDDIPPRPRPRPRTRARTPEGSTAASPSWSPAPASLLLGERMPSPPPPRHLWSPSQDSTSVVMSSSPTDFLDFEADTAAAAKGAEEAQVEADYVETLAKCTVNARYWFVHDQMTYFKVENEKFCVHRHFLERDSVYFQELFAGPLGDYGRTENEAIPLEDVTGAEFECLLDFFYNGMYVHTAFSLAQWVSLLSVSSRLQFELLRNHSIQQIEAHQTPLDPIDRLVLATKYDVPEWLAPAFTALCQRAQPLEEWEAEKIGLRNTVRVAKAREVFRDRVLGVLGSGVPSPAPSPVYSYWRPSGRVPSPVASPTIRVDADRRSDARASRIVDELFFREQ